MYFVVNPHYILAVLDLSNGNCSTQIKQSYDLLGNLLQVIHDDTSKDGKLVRSNPDSNHIINIDKDKFVTS